MAETRESREGVPRDAVIRPFARAVERPCARPSCGAPAGATLTFRYGSRDASIAPLTEQRDPQAYDLCATHAARTHPPRGWELRDHRPEGERQPALAHPTPVDLGGASTVAVLAAALRSVPDPVSEDAIADPAEVGRVVVATDGAPDHEAQDADTHGAAAHGCDDDAGAGRPVERAGGPDAVQPQLGTGELPNVGTRGVGAAGARDHAEPEMWSALVPGPRPPLAARQRD